jgi:hypothetical protein
MGKQHIMVEGEERERERERETGKELGFQGMAPIGLYLLKFPPPPNRAISWDQVFST